MTGYTAEHVGQARTFLFVPGDRPARFATAAASGADIVVIDLEDAVTPAAKPAAREHTRRWLADGHPAMVRINGTGTSWHHDDVRLVTDFPAATVMLPKAERAEQFTGWSAAAVVALVETACGVASAAAVGALPAVHRLAFGSMDLAAELGVDPAHRDALLAARSALVLASAQAGLPPPIDGVTADVVDTGNTAADTSYARSLGMTAKLCVHPRQVAAAHRALAPSAADINWARAVVDASGTGVTVVDGRMVDLPVLTRAQTILAATAGTSEHSCQ